ncbi:MAG: glycosyltransferase family 4 protein [Acidimicrobiia bacterium]
MRIAQIAPPWFPVPPHGYGGIEVVVSLLVEGLADAGHEVTLYASGGSRASVEVVSPLLEAPNPALLGSPWIDAFHATAVYDDIERREASGARFDVVHDHAGIAGPVIGARARVGAPVVHTLHGPWHETSRQLYGLIADRVDLVAISYSQRDENPNVPYAGVIHNGIDVDAYPLVTEKDDFCVYIGRATPDKGPTIAIEAARRAGLPLAMVVKRNEPLERAYWDEVVAPLLHDEVEVYEDVDHARKVDLLGRARAMIFPIQWPEPFGLVMVEAMACGTPVVTCPAGAAVELVEDGVTGFLRSTLDELAAGLTDARHCVPTRCRARVVDQFSDMAMVRAYEDLFHRLIDAVSTARTA